MKAETLKEVAEIIGMMEEAEAFKPIVKKILDVIIDYAKEIEEPLKDLGQWSRQNRVDSVAFYEGKGFTREEALLMTLHDSFAIKELMRGIRTKKD